MPSRSRYLRIADSSTFLMGRLSSRAMSVSARAMTVGPYARSASMLMAVLNSSWLVSWRWSRTMTSAPLLSRGVVARRVKASPFVETINLGIEKPLPFTGAAVVVLFAPGGLLGPAEGIPVPFVARVRGSTPFGVVVGRVDPCRVLLVQHPCRASIERVTSSGKTTDRRRIVQVCSQCGLLGGVGAELSFRVEGPGIEPLAHHLDGFRAAINHDELPACLACSITGGPASGEEVEHNISRLAAGLNDPTKDSKWLLRRVSGLFFAAGAHDGVPPGVRGELPLSGFLRSDEPR